MFIGSRPPIWNLHLVSCYQIGSRCATIVLMESRQHSSHCAPFHRAVELIGKRWTGAILRVLLQRPRRFSDFSEEIPDLSDRLLSERLKELEELGLVQREVRDTRPPQVSYRLTSKGMALRQTLGSLDQWAHRWGEAPNPDR